MGHNNVCHGNSIPGGRPLVATVRARGKALSGRRARATVGALVFAAIAGGCGGGGAKASNPAIGQVAPTTGLGTSRTSVDAVGTGPGTAASACNLLSEADVTAAMKQPMKVSGGAGGAICAYSATADPSALLYVQTFASRAEMATYTQLQPSSEHIDGLGDDAFWNPTLDMVFVLKGDRACSVTSPSLANLTGDPQASKSAMVDLAKIVLGKF
jgi:hypothetical protein